MDDLIWVINRFEIKPGDDWTVSDWQQWYDDFIEALRYEIKRAEEVNDERINYNSRG